MIDLDCFSCGPLATNAFLLTCQKTKSSAVIDPSQGSAAKLLQAANGKGAAIEKILLTHSHWDHIVDVASLVDKLHIPVFVHAEDRENLENPGVDGIPIAVFCKGVENPHLLEEGQILRVGNLTLKVLWTPGHSPGGVCFYAEEEKILFSGDTLFCGSMGALHLPTAQPEKMWQSLRRLAKLPSDVRVYPGHGKMTTIGEESWLAQAKEIFGN